MKFGRPNSAALKEGGRSSSDAPARHRTRNVLVVAQIALALMLMVVSGLMIRTFIALRQRRSWLHAPDEVQTFRIAIPPSLVADPRQAARTHESIAERLRQLPGVTSVGISSSITMDGEDNGNAIEIEEFPLAPDSADAASAFQGVAPGLLRDDGQSDGGGAGDHLDRHPPGAAGDCHLGGARARILARTGAGARQTRARRTRPGGRSSASAAMSATTA